MPTKYTFFKELSKYETADLFLTDRTDLLHKETYQNFVTIRLTTEIANQVSTEDVLEFLSKIKVNRQSQLINSNLNIDLLYYIWFDEMEAQLRLTFINSNHEDAPLEGDLLFVGTEHEVVYRFLTSPYLDGLLLSEINKKSPLPESAENEAHIWIYKERIVNSVR